VLAFGAHSASTMVGGLDMVCDSERGYCSGG
jgi:hypothetical protein